MAKIIEARALLTADDQASAKLLAMAKRVEQVTKSQQQFARAGGEQMLVMSKRVDELNAKLGKIDGFKKVSRDLNGASIAHRRAQQEANRLKVALDAAGGAGGKLARDYERAARAADTARSAFMLQGRAVRQARADLEAAGIPVNRLTQRQRELEQRVRGATAALQRQQQVASSPRLNAAANAPIRKQASAVAHGAAHALGAGYALHRGREAGRVILEKSGEFDYAIRRQRAFADMSAEEQARVLIPQAERIGADTKFTNSDIVEAQTTVANRLPAHIKNASTIAPLVAQMKNYALAMKGTTMDDAAQAVTGFLMSTGKDISTPEKADAESRRASNLLLRMSKLGAMSHNDVMPFVERGVSAGRIAGLSDETMAALAVGLKRSNISGDQAGTALRTLAAKLVAPTNKGLAALATAGINYSQFTKLPGGLSVDSLEGKFKQDFGKSFTPAIREKLVEALSDEEIIGDRGRFTEAVTDAVGSLFTPKKDGKMRASDRQTLAKKIGEFHKFSVENVDAEGLLSAILQRDPTLGVLNAFATDKHGNKLGVISKSFEQFQRDRDTIKNTPGDFGDKIAATITGGLGGALERLTGAVDTAANRIGRANESWLTPTIDVMGNSIEAIASAPPKLIEFTTQIGLAAAALLGLRSASMIASGVAGGATALGLGGGAVAALGSAGRTGATLASYGIKGLGWGAIGYGAYQGIKSMQPFADAAAGAAAGKHWLPKTEEDISSVQARIRELDSEIAGIQSRLHPSRRDEPNADVDRLRRERQDLQNRVSVAKPSLPTFAAGGFNLSDLSALQNLKAVVSEPIDVTGKLDPVELKGQATVDVRVKVDGPGQVAGMQASSSGNIKAEGTALIGRFGRN